MAKIIKYNVRANPKFAAFLKDLPRGTVRTALYAIAEWIKGNGQRGLARYPVYRYIKRAVAYGKTFFTDKQRRWFFGAKARGEILPGYPRRTGNTQRGYYIKEAKGGYSVSVRNDTAGAYYTRHDQGQARLNALAGWRKTADVVSTNIDGAIRHARAAVRAVLKKGR